ncbi:LysM peptidoglycan-binding domain-containing protein [Ornithinimicrobium sp. F0845]|uniref:LysM peptidoglycan-binding domain-containing protein n=1 Tax=Ornithinimicrobium sp. F0845 TaxID=2926412 RepID=UPI001FF246B1|nr:LysM peptidoglycan-binding domain-containing protein [Ornithinimicrobium sp. F0845]MCK0114157.1 LysM peptidoglycan-binding domain-containing protein [Ornithinimicrobium sp. F0845]
MSAIALHDLQDFETTQAGRDGGRTPGRRDHLRVVAPGERAPVDGGRTGQLVLTRRGRLAVTLTVATVLVLAVVAALGMLPATASAGHTVTVQPGDTLSQIAVSELPELPMDRAIVQIQLANDLNTLHIQAGMELAIPQP